MRIVDIAFSCYPVTEMARARIFYEEVLGLKATHLSGEPGGMQAFEAYRTWMRDAWHASLQFKQIHGGSRAIIPGEAPVEATGPAVGSPFLTFDAALGGASRRLVATVVPALGTVDRSRAVGQHEHSSKDDQWSGS